MPRGVARHIEASAGRWTSAGTESPVRLPVENVSVSRRFWPVSVATVVCVAAYAALAYAAFGRARVGDGLTFVSYLLGFVPLGLGWLIAVRAPTSPVGSALAWLAAFMLATPAVEAWGERPPRTRRGGAQASWQ